jgi:hypothetical protein
VQGTAGTRLLILGRTHGWSCLVVRGLDCGSADLPVCLRGCHDRPGHRSDPAHPSEPQLSERYVQDAGLCGVAEEAHGRIPRQVSCDYIWGDALAELAGGADRRIINLKRASPRATTTGQAREVHYHEPAEHRLPYSRWDRLLHSGQPTTCWIGIRRTGRNACALDEAGIRHAGAGPTQARLSRPRCWMCPAKREFWCSRSGR